MVSIVLFQFEECPYCAKVRAKLEEKGLRYEKVNVSSNRDDPLRTELFEKTNVHTVPVIKIGEIYIGDSGRIIQYLNESF
ncbi:glutathione S-transferase N-terminal domain-containing protein [Candidatus Woesearchaeota archaeon]|nr:glutathione S-transferase N-terminal domain-containing protein [Candidatus Woesearchaeota archaeon]